MASQQCAQQSIIHVPSFLGEEYEDYGDRKVFRASIWTGKMCSNLTFVGPKHVKQVEDYKPEIYGQGKTRQAAVNILTRGCNPN